MKAILLFFSVCALNFLNAQTENPNLDTSLVKKYGADDYGMKKYVFVVLKTGKNKSKDKAYLDSCFVGHMQNIKRLADENLLVVAGPFMKNDKKFRGLFILNVATLEEAEKLLATDPTIKEKIFDVDLFYWYGSAALPAYLDEHDKIWKVNP